MKDTENNEKIVQGTIKEVIPDNNDIVIERPPKPTLNVSIELYDGPLDALYNLVLKHKINIQEISLIEITTQLISFIKANPDMELSTELLNIVSRLIYLKSAFLLRRHHALEDEQALKEEEEEITRQLQAKLEEYSKFKHISELIAERLDYNNRAFFRNAPEIIIKEEFSTENITKSEISKALKQMSIMEIDNLKSNMIGQVNDSKLKKIYHEKMLMVEDKIKEISDELVDADELIISKYIKNYTKEGKIVTFLAILEMSKAKQIYITQEETLGEIYIRKNDNEEEYEEMELEYE